MVSKERVKNLLEDEWGEVILYMESGAKFEIHGDVDFDDDNDEIQFDTGKGYFYVDATAVENVEAHRSHLAGSV